MKLFHAALPLTLITLAACHNDSPDTPEEPAVYAVSEISSDEVVMKTEYSGGRASRWTCSEDDAAITATYTYPSAESIHILVTKTWNPFGEEIRRELDETIHLNADGLAARAEGFFKLTENGYILHKKYLYRFEYDSGKHLTAVDITEWSGDGNTWHEDRPWHYVNTLEWRGGNLTTYTDYLGNTKPYSTTRLTYYEGVAVTPDVVGIPYTLIRPYYHPLQGAGLFGQTSLNNLKTRVVDLSNGTRYLYNYSYDFSASATSSRIEGYSVVSGDGTSLYAVDWTKI